MKLREKIKTPSYMKNVPFFFITVLLAPVAILLVFLNWNKLTSQMRSNHLTFSLLMTLLYISKLLPDGTFKIVFGALTMTLILFVTYIFFGGGRKKWNSDSFIAPKDKGIFLYGNGIIRKIGYSPNSWKDTLKIVERYRLSNVVRDSTWSHNKKWLI